jgi:hypothetical protein
MMRFNRVALSAIAILFGACNVLAAELSLAAAPQGQNEGANPQPDRYRVFLLRFISSQDGQQFLADANIKTVSVLNDTKTLLVTAQPEVLIKAAALLDLVDSSEKYAVKALLPASEANRMPAADVIKAEIGNSPAAVLRQQDAGVSIGTFFSPPGSASHNRVIIDVHDDKLIAVALASVMDKLVAIAERVKPADSVPSGVQFDSAHREQGQVSNKTGVSEKEDVLLRADEQEPDKAFRELLDSIAEAEKTLAEQAREINQAQPSVALPAVSEPPDEIAAQPQAAEEQKESSPAQTETAPGSTNSNQTVIHTSRRQLPMPMKRSNWRCRRSSK